LNVPEARFQTLRSIPCHAAAIFIVAARRFGAKMMLCWKSIESSWKVVL